MRRLLSPDYLDVLRWLCGQRQAIRREGLVRKYYTLEPGKGIWKTDAADTTGKHSAIGTLQWSVEQPDEPRRRWKGSPSGRRWRAARVRARALADGPGWAALDRVRPMTSLPEGVRATCIRLQGKQRDGNGGRTLCVAVRPPLCQPLIEMMKDAPAPAKESQETFGWLQLLKKRNGDYGGQSEFSTATWPGGASPDDH